MGPRQGHLRTAPERALAWVGAFTMPLLLCAWLWQQGSVRMNAGSDGEQRIQMQWVPRIVSAKTMSPAKTTPPAHAPIRPGSTAIPTIGTTTANTPAASLQTPSPATSGQRRLDLSLHTPSAATPAIAQRQPWDRPPPMQFRGTRFNQGWVPDGGEIQDHWAHRSKLAAVLLSATGALLTPCTADERMRRVPKCFGIQSQAEEGLPDDPGN